MPSAFRLRLSKGLAAPFEGSRYRRGTIYETDDPDRYARMLRSGLFIEAEPKTLEPNPRRAEQGVSITVLRSAGLGDVLMALPAVQELARRNPWARVTFAVPLEFVTLLDAQPWITAVPISGKLEDRRINLSDLPERSPFARSWSRQAIFAHALGFPLDDSKTAAMRRPLRVEEKWRRKFLELFPRGVPLLVVAPKSTAADRTIDDAIIEEVATRFIARGWQVVGVRTSAASATDPGPMTVEELAGLISLADVTISADSGPLHVAGHLDVPVVGLFTNWSPRSRMIGYRGIGLEGSPSGFDPAEVVACVEALAGSRRHGPFSARAQEFRPIGRR